MAVTQIEQETTGISVTVAEKTAHNVPETDFGIKKRTAASAPLKVLSGMPAASFYEVWGYLISGEESAYQPAYPISDIGYFGAGLNTFGELVNVPQYNKVAGIQPRVHMVVADNGRALTHFCLNSKYPVHKKLAASIIKAAEPFDGLQIDFELVSAQDKENFWKFLKTLKKGIGKNKILSVAVPARTKTLGDDAYDYKQIAAIADRIIVMAYDEHWSTSAAGAVASMQWCRNIMEYAATVIPPEKLVMGLPFYGRAWSNDDTAGAYRFSSVERLFRGENAKGKLSADTVISPVERKDGIPTFTLSRNVTYRFYFDNAQSLAERLRLYNSGGVRSVAFWRLGQEDSDIWPLIKLRK